MPERQTWYRWQDQTLVLSVRVQPRAKRDELVGSGDGHLRVRIKAPPVDGKANDHLCRFLAGEFGVPPSRVALLAGARTRVKRVAIQAPGKLPDCFATGSQGSREARAIDL